MSPGAVALGAVPRVWPVTRARWTLRPLLPWLLPLRLWRRTTTYTLPNTTLFQLTIISNELFLACRLSCVILAVCESVAARGTPCVGRA
jgi:hypothetical protein